MDDLPNHGLSQEKEEEGEILALLQYLSSILNIFYILNDFLCSLYFFFLLFICFGGKWNQERNEVVMPIATYEYHSCDDSKRWYHNFCELGTLIVDNFTPHKKIDHVINRIEFQSSSQRVLKNILKNDSCPRSSFVRTICSFSLLYFFLFPFFPSFGAHPLSIRDRVLDYSNSYLNPKTSPTNSPQQIEASKIEFSVMQTLILKLASPQPDYW